ncbi:MAG: linearmycin resistance ATP-binding protein LnrL [Phototrophicaceae bacterium]
MTKMLEAMGLKKQFKQSGGKDKIIHAVRGVDLSIREGEIFSLLGPNGAGKTTTISMMSGLIQPTSGDAKIGGHSIVNEPMKAKQLLGVIPQEIALYPELTARQNLTFFGRMYGLTGKDLNMRADEVLEFIDLTDRQNDKVATFSGGMKRRVNIGVGLLHRPKLVYMDEPTVGIDPQSRRRILDTVFRLRDEYKMTVLYTTHMMEEAQELSDRVAIMDHGEIIAVGTQGELTQQVGEEDRLIISFGANPIPDNLVEKIQKQVVGVTRVEKTIQDLTQGAMGDKRATGSMPIVGANSETLLTVYVQMGRKALPRVLNVIDSSHVEVHSVTVREPDLEAVFLHLTGRALRD